ncbi:hypothetical protein WDU94_001268 [Cyamophila willieti]
MLGITLICFSMRKLVKYIPTVLESKRKANDSKLVDEEEVELYTIDSIDEFEKISKTETSTEAITDPRPEEMGRKKRFDHQEVSDDQDFSYETDFSYNSDPNNHSSHCNKDTDQQLNIFSVIAQPLNSIKTMLSQVTPNMSGRTNSTDNGKVDVPNNNVPHKNHGKARQENNSKRQHMPTRKQSIRGLLRETNTVTKPTKSTPSRRPLSKMLKNRSMNTEIRTYNMNDDSLTTEPDSLTENETDLETEMVMIDLPANYYYQNRLVDKKEPYLVSLKNRVKVK